MASDNEPAKLLLPYLQRADELQKHEPLLAYYCRLYAMERGLKLAQKTKTTNTLLGSIMNQLEKDKKSVDLGPDDHLHVEKFALNVFTKADNQDRAGRADLNTAKTFYAASIFFEILNQFGQLQPDLEQKQRYAAWKAADIRKALKEGRKPLPGPPGGEEDLSPPEYDIVSSRSDSASPSHHQGSNGSSLPNMPSNNPLSGECDSISRIGSISEPSVISRQECKNYEPSGEQISEAQKAARFAVGALAFNDVLVAVEHLNKSLELLTKPSAGH